MASKNGTDESGNLNLKPVIKPKTKIWFLNGDLVRVIHTSRAAGIVTLYNKTKDQMMTTTVVEFKKKRKKAFLDKAKN